MGVATTRGLDNTPELAGTAEALRESQNRAAQTNLLLGKKHHELNPKL